MTHDDQAQAIFGSLDGATSAVGVVAAALIAGDEKTLLAAAVGLAAAATVGMASGEWLSDRGKSFRRALVMGAATLVGSLVPAIPFFFSVSKGLQVTVAILLTLALGSVVAELRPGGRGISYLQTFGVLVSASALAVAAAAIAT